MLLPLLSFLAVAAAQPADMMVKTRDDYATCLRKFVAASLDKKMDPIAFDKVLQPACEKQEATFRAAVIAADKADKMSDADAQEDAQFQVEDYLDKFQNSYRDYLETNTRPG
ncbi:hypothetical protein [Rhizorhapis sp. SPR117]|uniref:hypothetical protein n=1 Tax=Rhizorhapis sp. SPR117 TaxID=2912611 RepID=UPI001F316486|nr:hypothetical protein [Rhizorhapis sp. SPR117]